MKRYYITHCNDPRDIDALIANEKAFKNAKRDGRFILLDDDYDYICKKRLEEKRVLLQYTRRFEVRECMDDWMAPVQYSTDNREYAAIEATKRRRQHPEWMISAYDTHLKQYYI